MVNEDIVTRLREHWEDEKMLGNDWLCEVLRDASDEIKRLREELKESEEKVRVLVAAIQHSGELARENW